MASIRLVRFAFSSSANLSFYDQSRKAVIKSAKNSPSQVSTFAWTDIIAVHELESRVVDVR
jgi:hypothetical protein